VLDNHNVRKIGAYFREIVFRSVGGFGEKTANFAINFGYLIKNSKFYGDPLLNKQEKSTRKEFYQQIITEKNLENERIFYMEFGVFQGKSFKYWLEHNKNPNSLFFGFDTFTGLPEDWGHIAKGHFDVGGSIPQIEDHRHQFFKGLFHDTLPKFLDEKVTLLKKPIKLIIHFDADLYSSTLYTLIKMAPFFKDGDILIFDEFFSVVNASTEFRGYLDFASISDLEIIPFLKTRRQCGMVIRKQA
jgi:hypothetical protein